MAEENEQKEDIFLPLHEKSPGHFPSLTEDLESHAQSFPPHPWQIQHPQIIRPTAFPHISLQQLIPTGTLPWVINRDQARS